MSRSAFWSFPLVSRELRSQARSKGTFILRSLAASALLTPLVFLGITKEFQWQSGSAIFGFFAALIFYGLMLLGPLIATGCITSEKEGGTLGLLFLSPLRSLDIVAGKFAAQFLRLFTLAAAGIPVLAASMAWGGVTGQQMIGAAISILALLVLIVAASVFCSAVSSKTQDATLRVFFYLGAVNFCVWPMEYGLQSKFNIQLPEWVMLVSPAVAMAEQFAWTRQNYLGWAAQTFGVACAQALVFLALASWWLPKTLALSGNEGRWKWRWRRVLRKHIPSLARWSNQLRDRNPLFWLEWRKFTTGNAAGLLLVIGLGAWLVWEMYPRVAPGGCKAYEAMIYVIPWHVLVAALAVGSVCREMVRDRQAHSLELLLCTPFPETRMVWNRIWGGWLRYGTIYLALSLPTVVLAIMDWRRLPFVTQGTGGQDSTINIVMIESAEDVTFFFMLLAVALRMALFSSSATNAILKSVAWIGGGIVAWLLIGMSWIWLVDMYSAALGEWGIAASGYLILTGKIIAEIAVASRLLKTLPGHWREQHLMTPGIP